MISEYKLKLIAKKLLETKLKEVKSPIENTEILQEKATGQHKEINMRTGILIITDIYIVIKMIFVITFYVIHIVNI